MPAVTHPRVAAARAGRPSGWWARAWLRAVEEAAYGEDDLRRGRALARAGQVGAVTVDAGGFVAAVTEDGEAWTVSGAVDTWDATSVGMLVEVVATRSGRIGALLAGDLPLGLVEDAEEAGVELVPYAGELGATCTCRAWVDPCRHALATLVVLARLVDGDPLVLFHLRGLDREDLLARLHRRTSPTGGAGSEEPEEGRDPAAEADLDTGVDAALRAARLLELVDRGDPAVDHLL
ncbi:hypothetical protein GCM10009737_02650 [Nocardioides lentus]|uniref:SWIM-type domain-containing protein n=1 Tax=Nocardioides lentus TaxID=338077 RepID=A0ABN2NZT1_9ACTN